MPPNVAQTPLELDEAWSTKTYNKRNNRLLGSNIPAAFADGNK
jgi:hypothetical protein